MTLPPGVAPRPVIKRQPLADEPPRVFIEVVMIKNGAIVHERMQVDWSNEKVRESFFRPGAVVEINGMLRRVIQGT